MRELASGVCLVTPIAATEEVDIMAGDESRWDFSSLEGSDQMFESYDSENNY